MNTKLLLLMLLAMFTSNSAYSNTVGVTSGTVTEIRTSSTYHQSIQDQTELETIFKLSSGYTDCEWVGVNNTNAVFISLLLASKAQSKQVKVWYYRDKLSPKWSSVCQAITIEAN